ncbi:MAG: hypothetical protein MUD14_06560 [Hydrococcus sp. Prado102]|jgi:hypothetical protein|nr:hypothetical protein [Hydrococcus sp. Prado102]
MASSFKNRCEIKGILAIALVAQTPTVTPQSPNFKIPDCSSVSQTD